MENTIDKTPKKEIIIIQGDWNTKVGIDAKLDWKGTCRTTCNSKINSRGEKLLEFANYDNLILANTLGNHKNSCKRTRHAPNGIHHNQIGYIMIPQYFKNRIKQASNHTFSGVDIGSNHDLVMMNACMSQENQEAAKSLK